ncbi:undecaprenyldiphospho-muramoylpentapeptide beta- N-acetylglucosaminyltransferase [Desulfonema ishimotonii]|uniref:UDP-N-acetylglucosamine--N-acetylmuramyl-(pentapeptide) pyrophosphoryl-undecaprenol N-acetylglucosamine transferase n=1 Tax=Desulfonema ishimotonii TaxID=45657 RepID=A0A401FYF0_9BACT|nr:undecaprenyldiphospho-muramoylpentapeptide beta-N-acetylglucosaminyltransferase [Desulfonema ishimotonii]GBC61985.1 undecaprenyldiphospho-muramoylpentapeptide beta- N-acetylglucosaminyltransferase [Desulfonema ishimotonii]
MNRPLNIIIAGGGTGGHLFPGIAIADGFRDRNRHTRILFVSVGRPFELEVLAKAGYPHRKVTSEGFKGRGLRSKARSVMKIPLGIFEAGRIIREFGADLVIGVGGYSAGPVVMAARLMGIRTALHEQNILPGITNRILARFVDRIYTSFQNTAGGFAPEKTLFTGNPVRRTVLAPEPGTEAGDFFNVLIVGGSQGAHRINTALAEALPHLRNRSRFSFVHQTGPRDREWVRAAYGKHGVRSTVRPFIDDMGRQYGRADLLICRAGATTVAEITAIGKGAILIPFPFAADNHQVMNARTLAAAGAAEMVEEKDLTGRVLADRIRHYADRPALLAEMAGRSGALGRADAAAAIADDCCRLSGRESDTDTERKRT